MKGLKKYEEHEKGWNYNYCTHSYRIGYNDY